MNTSPGAFRHPFYQDEDGVNRPTGPHRHPLYRRFAREGRTLVPLVRRAGGQDVPAYLVCRYEDVCEVLRDQRTFSRSAAANVDDVDVSGTMLGMDGPEHGAVRGIVKKAFLPAAVADLAEMVETRAAARLAIMTADGRRNADLVTDFALPFALHTIADMLGLPDDEKERLQFHQWGDAFLGTADADRAAESALQMAGYLGHQLHQRRDHPAGDLLTRIAVDGAAHPPEIQVLLAISLIVGGWETTASSIARYVYVLRTEPYGGYPTGWDYLLDHPDHTDTAVTELERLFSTSAGDDMPRRAMRAVTLPSGASLAEGDVVIPSHDAANLDPRVFDEPERMDFTRDPNPHLSFGFGAHHCVGAHLGALETRTGIRMLLRELPALRLDVAADPASPGATGDVHWKPGHSLVSPIAVPIIW